MTNSIWLNKTEFTLDEMRFLISKANCLEWLGGQWATDHECLEIISLLTKK